MTIENNIKQVIEKYPELCNFITQMQVKGYSDKEIINTIINYKKQKLIEKARTDFKTFCFLFYEYVSADSRLENTQHVDILINLCQLKVEKRLLHKNLTICIPPGHTKTTICNILFSAWALGRVPSLRIIYGCNSTSEGNKRNKDLIDLMNLEEYKKCFPNTTLTNQNVTWFITTKGGFRQVVSTDIKKRFTGGDADLLLIDDPNDTTGTQLDFEKVEEWFWKKAMRRLRGTNRQIGCFLIQQMTGIGCLANKLIDDKDTLTVKLPAEIEEDINIQIPLINNEIYNIHLKAGYLWDKKKEEYEKLKIGKRDIWETQYQQNPTQANEQIISIKDHHYYNSQDISQFNFNHIIISVDAASSDNVGSDYTAMLCFGIRDKTHYLLELMRVKCVYDDMERQFAQFYAMCQNDYKTPTFVIVENKSNGPALLSRLRSYMVTNPNTQQPINACFYAMEPISNKVQRLREVSGHINNDYFKIPIDRKGVAEYVFELEQFPNAKNDDYVDATSQYIKKMHEILYGA